MDVINADAEQSLKSALAQLQGSVKREIVSAEALLLDALSGIVTFNVAPGVGAVLTARFEFDVPVRFDIDRIDIDLAQFDAGRIPSIPLVEIRP